MEMNQSRATALCNRGMGIHIIVCGALWSCTVHNLGNDGWWP